ncbi:MAG TPA: hypothetical protein PLP01_01540 [Phycisphaerae bacterium]|nr:hypothetical protein [Phycisphaerae bacterium]HOI53910.1 hypothetical protein [Phycisphaerae bacterium]
MLSKGVVGAALLLAVAMLAGCGEQQSAGQEQRLARQGHAVHLFGPTPLALGEEDMGYFACSGTQQPVQSQFDYHATFVRERTWEVEDNRSPYHSYHRRTTWAEDVRASYR